MCDHSLNVYHPDVCVCVRTTGADLKERALMNNTESDLFVHSLRSLMTQIGTRENICAESEQLLPK